VSETKAGQQLTGPASPNLSADSYAGAAEAYARYRVPYPAELLADLRHRASVTGQGRLLDLACGPGRLALPLAPYFSEVWAVDQEPEMVKVGSARAQGQGLSNIRWMVGRAEEVDASPESLELIAIGEAFHRLDQRLIAERAMEWLAPGCGLATLGCFSLMQGREPWHDVLRAVVRRWRSDGSTVTTSAPLPSRPRGSDHDRKVLSMFGFEDLGGFFETASFTARYSDFLQDEIEMEGDGPPELETRHENRSLVFRGELEGSRGRFQSRVGAWANLRDFTSAGPEALAPDTRHTALAAFALGEVEATDRLSVLLGARLENNAYDPDDRPEPGEGDDDNDDEEEEEFEAEGEEFEPPAVVDREFLGASASAGLRLDLDDEHALVGTATLSTRAPALEELYNFGLDAGIQAFEIGNPPLERERSRGFDLSLPRDSGIFAASEAAGAVSSLTHMNTTTRR